MQKQITFGPLAPDNADHLTDAMQAISGAYPSANGYRPVGSFSQFASALTGTFKGGGAFIATDGTIRLIAGDETSLYAYSSSVWASRISSLSVNTRWDFTQFGDLIVGAYGSTPVKYDIVADTATTLGGSPPSADFCTTVREFVVLGRAGGVNNKVYWSQQGNAEGWTVGTSLCGFQQIYAGGKIMGLAGGEYGLILQRFQIVRMSFTGDSTYPWQFDAISTNYGCAAEGSVVQAGRMVFFYSDRGFCVCDGTDVKQIGVERIDATFRDRYSASDLSNMWAAVDPERTLAIWAMPGILYVYNWTLDRWSTVELSVSAIFNSFSQAVSLETLSALYGSIDSIPYSLDDARFAGGSPRLTVVSSSGAFGVLSGPAVAAEFTTPRLQLADGRVARVRFIRPITDAIDGLSLSVDSRQRLGDAENVETFNQLQASGDMPVRIAATASKWTLSIAEGTDWDFCQGFVAEYDVGGRR